MFEPFMRASIGRLQPFYDRLPSPARTLLTSARGWFLSRIRYAPETFSFLEQLRAHEAWTPDDISSFQIRALQETISHARATVPYYANYPRIELRNFDSLRLLPVLTRESVRENRGQFLSRDIAPHHRIVAGTTGTTGGNLKVAYTEKLARENWAFLLQQRMWAGVSPRQPRVTLFGARVVPTSRTTPPFWTHNLPERQILLSIFHLSERTAADYLTFLHEHQGVVLEGFPSVLSILADFALSRGESIPMRAVFTSGEALYPAAREKIESAFQATTFDSYGMTEYCGLIQQCEKGEMHLAPEYGYLEILDENNAPVAADEEGYFVWTGFLNRAMPLVRYRIGDRGASLPVWTGVPSSDSHDYTGKRGPSLRGRPDIFSARVKPIPQRYYVAAILSVCARSFRTRGRSSCRRQRPRCSGNDENSRRAATAARRIHARHCRDRRGAIGFSRRENSSDRQ
jgi:phenylacetate-coenzyme A ligase PaaK-like adenylate-forming protein